MGKLNYTAIRLAAIAFECVWATPLGRPVVPEENSTKAKSSIETIGFLRICWPSPVLIKYVQVKLMQSSFISFGFCLSFELTRTNDGRGPEGKSWWNLVDRKCSFTMKTFGLVSLMQWLSSPARINTILIFYLNLI